MKKTMTFNSYDAFDAWVDEHDYHEVPVVIDDGWTLTYDITTECKSWRTAVRRFMKAFEGDEFAEGWGRDIQIGCEGGEFSQAWSMRGSRYEAECRKNGVYGWGVEDCGNGDWYVYLTLTGVYAGHEPVEAAEQIAESAGTEDTMEIAGAVETSATVETVEEEPTAVEIVNEKLAMTIRDVARESIDAMRDGICGLLLWKVGRGWKSEIIWDIDYDSYGYYTLTSDTAVEMFRAAEAEDSNAMILNSYYDSVGLDEDGGGSINDLAKGLKFQYDSAKVDVA